MALKTEVPKSLPIYDDSFIANESLASSQYSIVVFTNPSSGQPKVGLPSGQGVLAAGALLNAPAIGEIAQVRMLGCAPVKANSSFNAGVELTIAATTGKVEAASSGDYVVGIALEAASAANHVVKVLINTPYQKN